MAGNKVNKSELIFVLAATIISALVAFLTGNAIWTVAAILWFGNIILVLIYRN